MTLDRILTAEQSALLLEERRLLAEVELALGRSEASEEDLATLGDSVRQLDELFLLVVVGEFNSGKSAFINALLGERLLEEGVTPTTSRIHLIRHGEAVGRQRLDGDREAVASPSDLLRELTIVDTPGTNALDRRHEALTSDFVPRSDLVLFVTSADRPFSESERAFLESVRQWGKKIIVVLNKVDIMSAAEIAEVETYIADNSRLLLDMAPPIFAVSSRLAMTAREAADEAGFEASGLGAVERHLRTTLDDSGRIRLKLANPLGVAARQIGRYLAITDELYELIRADLKTLDDIERQLATYAEDVAREFELRLSDIDLLLHAMEKRGLDFFDERLRLRRLPELLKREQLRSDFERLVVADMSQQIEAKVESIIDWLVASDLDQWQAVVEHVNRRRTEHAERIVGDVASRFSYDRDSLLATVGRAARDGLGRYDRAAEAQRIADGVQRALAGTALVEVGAVGLGATISLLASGSMADATGLLAAGVVAALGLYILPHRRRRAKRELREKIEAMRSELMSTLRSRFEVEADKGRARIRETIAPYGRFVRAERDRLEQRRAELGELEARIDRLQAGLDELSAGTTD